MKIIKRLKIVFTVYRHLLFFLSLKNLKIQYKYAFLGFLWAFFVPLCMALIFWFLFAFIFQRPIPPLSMVTALFVWQFINLSVSGATSSILDNAGILKKVYFPREIIPFSIVFSNFINFILSLVVLIGLVLAYNLFKGISPVFSRDIIFLPPIILLTLVLTMGLTLLTSCLQVFYRDVRYIVEVVLLVWFYMSGVFYDVDLVAQGAQLKGLPWLVPLFMLNPLYALFTMYRSVLLPRSVEGMVIDISLYYSPRLLVAHTIVICLAVFAAGYYIFIKRERGLVDFI